MKIKFNEFLNEEESFIKIPKDPEYWLAKGKRGKECIIFCHDDLDGCFSAIAMKEYLQNHGFVIKGYGIINYTDGWRIFKLDKSYINICLDFADDNKDLDLYIDHHMDDNFKEKSKQSIKMKSDSCYGLICHLLGIPTNKSILSVISMIDAAKYSEYEVDIKTILNFELKDILLMKNPGLVFAGAFNQLIKRSDYRTLIEVIYNGNLSIYKIFELFKILYPFNNIVVKKGSSKNDIRKQLLAGEDVDSIENLKEVPEFVPDSKNRINKMISRTRGNDDKQCINSLEQFNNLYWKENDGKFKFDGFVVIKNLVFVPSGTYANPLRARAIIEKTLKDDSNIQFIMMDYGSAIQIADYRGIKEEKNLPVLSNGRVLNDLNIYTKYLLEIVLRREFDYHYDKAKAGGHSGIGNLTNIFGKCQKPPYNGIKIMDIMKNWIIRDITGIEWDINLIWNKNESVETKVPEIIINKKLMMIPELRKVYI